MANVELLDLGNGARYLPSGANIGVWEGPEGAVLVDTGNGPDMGRRILKALAAADLSPAAVFLTHSNADHMGGGAFIAARAGIPIYASRIEAAFCGDPLLESSFIFGAFPPPELRGPFFVAPSFAAAVLDPVALPSVFSGASVVELPGHFFAQQGFLASGVLFAGDALFGPAALAKHPVFFLYDVDAFLDSLHRIQDLSPRLLLPSHGNPTEDVPGLCAANRTAVERVCSAVLEAVAEPASTDEALARLCLAFGITLDWAQYALVGSTLRSYLVYLRGRGQVSAEFSDARLTWTRT